MPTPQRRMTPEAISAVLGEAIRERHAVTVARGGRPFLAEPYALRRVSGRWVLTVWNADAHRIVQMQVATITDVTDLGKPLDAIRPPTDDEGEIGSRHLPMGRPRQYESGERRRVTLELPTDLLAAVEASGVTLTDWIAEAMRVRLAQTNEP